MKHKRNSLEQTLKAAQGSIFYCSAHIEKYVQNAVAYIVAGIEQGEHILLVENHKLYSFIQQKLKKQLNKDQLQNVHYRNNFDFYFSENTFHPVQIITFFSSIVQPSVNEKMISVRIWSHVEWRNIESIEHEISQYGNQKEQKENIKLTAAVSAYDEERLPGTLKEKLVNCYDFLMDDDQFIKRE